MLFLFGFNLNKDLFCHVIISREIKKGSKIPQYA
nr:MAG TPA: hypothetical protein [Caudoviricetes sp.]